MIKDADDLICQSMRMLEVKSSLNIHASLSNNTLTYLLKNISTDPERCYRMYLKKSH